MNFFTPTPALPPSPSANNLEEYSHLTAEMIQHIISENTKYLESKN